LSGALMIAVASAAVAHNTSDKKFWLGLVERWHALESQNVWQLAQSKPRSRLRRQQALSIHDLE